MSARTPEPIHEGGFPSSSFKYTPLRHVRVLFIRFVQGLFHGAPPGAYHWEADEEKTELLVTNENRLDPEVLMHRPAVSLTRGPIQFYSTGIDDLYKYESDIDRKTKDILVPGTMMLNCLSRSMLESEDLAWIVAEHLWLLRDLLMKAGFFDVGRAIQIGSPSPAGSLVANDQGDEFTVTAITVPYQFARTSSFTPLGQHIVSNIRQELSLATPPRVYSAGPPRGFGGDFEVPVQVVACPPPPFAPDAADNYGRTPDPAGARQVFLPKQPHPLNPAVTVRVRTVRPYGPGVRFPNVGQSVPIPDPCVKES